MQCSGDIESGLSRHGGIIEVIWTLVKIIDRLETNEPFHIYTDFLRDRQLFAVNILSSSLDQQAGTSHVVLLGVAIDLMQ